MASERDRANEASNDAEIKALTAITRALRDLDRPACTRVLNWAQERYVTERLPGNLDPNFITNFMESIAEAARQMGSITPLDIIKAASAIGLAVEESDEAAAMREP